MTAAASATVDRLADAGVDGLALKPTELDLGAAANHRALAAAPIETAVVDFEGTAALPDADTLAALADAVDALRVTTPVRADGFDPQGDDTLAGRVPTTAGRVLVAGHPAYLTGEERRRAVAPRLRTAADAAERKAGPAPWVGTEGVERVALAVGATQFELLAPGVAADVRALRAAGFDGEVAVYAPTVCSTDADTILDAVGEYAARRPAVADDLPADAPRDANATGAARERLLEGAREYGLVGDVATVRERIQRLREAGVDRVVAYPAAGLDELAA